MSGASANPPAGPDAPRRPWSRLFEGREQGNVHAVETAAGSIWVGCCRNPSLLLKVTPGRGETVPIRFDDGSGLHDLAFDGEHLLVAHASGHLSRIDPQTDEVHTRRIELTSGQRAFLYALHFDGRDLWAGTYTDPGCLLRIDRQSGSHEQLPLPAAPMWSVRTLVSAGDALWVALYTVLGKIIVVDKRSGEQNAIELDAGNILCTSSCFNGRHVWIGLDTMPARLLRIDPHSGEARAYDLHPGSSCVHGLVFDGRYLWLGLYTEPGELVRFDPQTGDFRRHVMPDAFYNVRDLAVDGERVWAVTQNVRYQPSGLYGLPLDAVEGLA